MKIKLNMSVLWPVFVAFILGVLIIGLVFRLLGFSSKISEYYTPVIIASENFMEATSHLQSSINKEERITLNKDMSFVHFKDALEKFRAVLNEKKDKEHIDQHENQLFKYGYDIIKYIEGNQIKKVNRILNKVFIYTREHYSLHRSELKSAKDKVTFDSYAIVLLCGLILFMGVVISFRERKSQEIEKKEIAIVSAIKSLINALEARDKYTKGHSTRVQQYAVAIAEELNSEKIDISFLKLSALMHDIGKIGLPDKILLKEDKLTDDEYNEIKKHPIIGANIISDSENLNPILPGILYHHERFDGKGYPEGLNGDSIPLCAQCLALADTFDAMTSSRPYRKALSLEYTLKEIDKCRNKQWSSEVVDAFFSCIEKGTIIKIKSEN